jgi:ectoine hydroxylase-related dioxygenase (phytanoyl-CoA dioxygenase family)
LKQVFYNNFYQTEIDQKGFVVIDFFSPAEVQELQNFYQAHNTSLKKGFHSTQADLSVEYRKKVFEVFSQKAVPHLNKIVKDYTPVAASFVVKEPDAKSAVRLHQDWNLTRESEFPAYNIWSPLTDTTASNGALHLVAGSHRLLPTFRGTGLPDSSAKCQGLKMEQLTCVPLKAGQGIVYDVRVLHASPPNTSNSTRVACALGIVPKETPLLHYGYNPETGLVSMLLPPGSFLPTVRSRHFLISSRYEKQ